MNVRCRFRSDLQHSRSFDRMQVIFSHVSYWLCRDKIPDKAKEKGLILLQVQGCSLPWWVQHGSSVRQSEGREA